jgi:hypothetical protein
VGPRLPAGGFQIGFFHRHGLEVFGRQRRVRFSNGFSSKWLTAGEPRLAKNRVL